jgi:heme oxygenase
LFRFLRAARPLYRASAFKGDLEFFLGPHWRDYIATHSTSNYLRAYLHHLETLADRQPLLLIAHSYTQHLAVASGGQILAKLVQKGLKVDAEAVASFSYSTGRPRDLKLEFKRIIDNTGESISRDEFQKVRAVLLLATF